MRSPVLHSWKEIAAYLNRGIRTIQRWEAELGMPVHRCRDQRRDAVLAFPDELDDWLRQKSFLRKAVPARGALVPTPARDQICPELERDLELLRKRLAAELFALEGWDRTSAIEFVRGQIQQVIQSVEAHGHSPAGTEIEHGERAGTRESFTTMIGAPVTSQVEAIDGSCQAAGNREPRFQLLVSRIKLALTLVALANRIETCDRKERLLAQSWGAYRSVSEWTCIVPPDHPIRAELNAHLERLFAVLVGTSGSEPERSDFNKPGSRLWPTMCNISSVAASEKKPASAGTNRSRFVPESKPSAPAPLARDLSRRNAV